MGVLLGIDMQGFAREEGSDEMPPGMGVPTQASASSSTSGSSNANAAKKAAPTPAEPKPAEPADVTMADPEEADVGDEEAKAKKGAEAEKQRGSEAYKRRDFEAAAASFQRAWEMWPKDITFLTNLSGEWGMLGDVFKAYGGGSCVYGARGI